MKPTFKKTLQKYLKNILITKKRNPLLFHIERKKAMQFKQIELSDLNILVKMYIETFNAGPWNDEWTVETASRRLTQMIKCPDSYGLLAYVDNVPAGMILGAEEQYYNGLMFNIKEFCINNQLRGKGLGTSIYEEFEKRLKEKESEKLSY